MVPFNFDLPKNANGFLPPREVQFILSPLMTATQFSINFFSKLEYLFHMRADFKPGSDSYHNNN
jgi:hypothetical protein